MKKKNPKVKCKAQGQGHEYFFVFVVLGLIYYNNESSMLMTYQSTRVAFLFLFWRFVPSNSSSVVVAFTSLLSRYRRSVFCMVSQLAVKKF